MKVRGITMTSGTGLRTRALSLAAAVLLVAMQALVPASVLAADGDGTVTVSPTSVKVGSTGNTLVFTHTLATTWSSTTTTVHLQIAVPTAGGWSTPTTSGTSATVGHVAVTADTCGTRPTIGVSGSNIQVSGNSTYACNAGDTITVTYYLAAAPSTTGTSTFTASTRTSGSSGSLQAIASSPTVSVSADGTGTVTVSPTAVLAASTGNTLTFTYTLAYSWTSTTSAVRLQIAVPAGWSTPTTGAGAGHVALSASTCTTNPTIGVSGSNITVTGTSNNGCNASDTITVTYSTTAPATTGSSTFTASTRTSGSTGSLVAIDTSPTVDVTGDGSGTVTVSPTSVFVSSTGNTLVFTHTLATAWTSATSAAHLQIAVPAGWSTPTTSGTASTVGHVAVTAHTCTTTPTIGVSGSNITVSGSTGNGCNAADTITVTYYLAAAPGTVGTSTFTSSTRTSGSTGGLAAIATSPTVSVDASPDGSGTMTANTAKVGSATYTTFPIVAGMDMELVDYIYTASATLGSGSQVSIVIPAGWTTPTKTAGSGGTPQVWGALTVLSSTCTAPATGTGGFTLTGSGPWTITFTVQCAAGQTFTLRYGNGLGYLVQAPSTAGTYTFTTQSKGSSGTLAPIATQPTLDVVAGHLVFVQQPTSAVAGASITPAVTVQLKDPDGANAYTMDSITLAIDTNPGSGTLSGTKTVAAASGLATFTGLSIDKAGTGYTLKATATGQTDGTSSAFNISATTASKLVITSVNGGSDATVGLGFPVVVQAQDTYGNPANVTSNTGISLTRATGAGTVGGTTTGQIDTGTSSVTISGVTYSKAESGVSLTAARTSGMTPLASGTSALFTVVGTGTTTALTSDIDPSVHGQSVTFTATVTPAVGSGTPTGTVTFFDGATSIGSGTLSGGVATFTTSALSAGSHTISAVYAGDGDYGASTSPGVTQVVDPASTTTALATAPNPSVYGQSVTLTATVTVVPPGAGTPTGTVTFFDGATNIGSGTLSGGVATLTTSALPVGADGLTAVYAGDTDDYASTSPLLTHTVLPASTTTSLTSDVNPSTFGQSVTFTATVSAVPPGAGTPTGSVTFYDALDVLGTATLDASGVATLTTSALAVATHPITASYGGDTNFTSSTSPQLSQVVDKGTQETLTITGPTSMTFGDPDAEITTSGGSGTGTITFSAGASTACSIVDGKLHILSATGTCTITATKAGDGDYNETTSDPFDVTIDKGTQATLTITGPTSMTFGDPDAVITTSGGSGTGAVTFSAGASTACSIVDGKLHILSATGTCTITATKAGDGDYNETTSDPFDVTIGLQPTTTVLESSPNPSLVGQSVTFTATVSDVAAGARVGDAGPAGDGIPTGTVAFYDGLTNLGTGTLDASGVATFTTSALTQGLHEMTAEYSGDADHASSDSPVLDQSVGLQPTTTSLTSSVNPSLVGQPVTFTATVSDVAGGSGVGDAGPAVDGIPTGTVTFYDGLISLGTGTIDASGVATFTTSALTAGLHLMTAGYDGDAHHAASDSPALDQVVAPESRGQTITFTSVPPSPAVVGLRYHVSAAATSGLPVSFRIAAASSQVCWIVDGEVTFLAHGTCIIEADQPGDADWDPAPTAYQEVTIGLAPPRPHPTEPPYPSFPAPTTTPAPTPTPTPAPTATPSATPEPASLTLAATETLITWGDELRLSAALSPASAGRPITFARSVAGGDWVELGTVPTDANGQVMLFRVYDPKTNAKYRATFAGASDLAAATSQEITILVRQTVVLRPARTAAAPEEILLGAEMTLTATARPITAPAVRTRVTFSIYRRDDAAARWVLVDTETVDADADGIAVLTYRPDTSGRWYAVARAEATSVNLRSTLSGRTYFNVR